jgi:hypothetical protein
MIYVRDPFTEAVQGPITPQKLRELASAGEIDPAWEIAKSEAGPWTEAGLVKGLSFGLPKGSGGERGDVSVSKSDGEDGRLSQQSVDATVVKTIADHVQSIAKTNKLDDAVQASDPLFRVVLKIIYGAKEYSFHDNEFPVLSACLRIGATFLRLWFIFGLLGLLISGLALVIDSSPKALLAFCQLTGDNPMLYVVDGQVSASVLSVLWAVVRHSFYFLAFMGGCEFVRVIMCIEKNTRRAAG